MNISHRFVWYTFAKIIKMHLEIDLSVCDRSLYLEAVPVTMRTTKVQWFITVHNRMDELIF